MSAIATRGQTLAAMESQIDAAMRKGEDAFQELASAIFQIHRQELWRQATVPVGPDTEERRACKSFVEWCEVCREKSGRWGHNFLSAYAYRTIVQNEAQARELRGLSEDDARRVVDKATENGTRETTAAELKAMRAKDAIEQTGVNKKEAGRRLRTLQSRDWIERVEGKAEALRKALRQEVGTEAAEAHLEACLEECRQLAA